MALAFLRMPFGIDGEEGVEAMLQQRRPWAVWPDVEKEKALSLLVLRRRLQPLNRLRFSSLLSFHRGFLPSCVGLNRAQETNKEKEKGKGKCLERQVTRN